MYGVYLRGKHDREVYSFEQIARCKTEQTLNEKNKFIVVCTEFVRIH